MRIFDNTPITFLHNSKTILAEVSGHPDRILQIKSSDPEFLKIHPPGVLNIPHYTLKDPEGNSHWAVFMRDLLPGINKEWERVPAPAPEPVKPKKKK